MAMGQTNGEKDCSEAPQSSGHLNALQPETHWGESSGSRRQVEWAGGPDELQRADIRQRIAAHIATLAFHKYGVHLATVGSDSAVSLAEEIEQAAYDVMALAKTTPTAERFQGYVHLASISLLDQVNHQGEMLDTVAMDQALPTAAAASPAAMAHSPAPPMNPFLNLVREPLTRDGSGGLSKRQSLVSLASGASGGMEDVVGKLGAISTKAHRTYSRSELWGWLEPGSRVLPYVLLRGPGVAIGRGRETFEARHHTLNIAMSGNAQPSSPSSKRMGEVLKKAMGFIEVADGRVSRLHCTIQLGGEEPVLEDCSSNGTFVNGEKAPKGACLPLKDGDKISLVQSVAPLVEQYFIFRAGDPWAEEPEAVMEWIDTAARPWTPRLKAASLKHDHPLTAANGARTLRRPSGGGGGGQVVVSANGNLARMMTSIYTTADGATLDDFQCQICLGTLHKCVALQPCGHNFCAACLSHHFAALLQGGLPLTCPLRCPGPLTVVANTAVRAIIQLQQKTNATGFKRASLTNRLSRSSSVHASHSTRSNGEAPHAAGGEAGAGGGDEDEVTQMSAICPLHDEYLPIDASSLKSKQVEVSLGQLAAAAEAEAVMAALEALARLAWSDDNVRRDIANLAGVEAIVASMDGWRGMEGVQCNGCLALMSLVRGEGPVCQENQWRVAKVGGVEAIVAGMREFPLHPMVQLSALLCMIPLALENAVMQAHLARLALREVLAALRNHAREADIQAKGMVVLGVLGQGEEGVHDGIRQQQLEAGAPRDVARALAHYGADSDEVLWAALFALAVLVREGGNPYRPATRAVAAAGTLRILQAALADYKASTAAQEDGGDEMIITAGDYLIKTLEPAARRLRWERHLLLAAMSVPFIASAVAYGWKSFGSG